MAIFFLNNGVLYILYFYIPLSISFFLSIHLSIFLLNYQPTNLSIDRYIFLCISHQRRFVSELLPAIFVFVSLFFFYLPYPGFQSRNAHHACFQSTFLFLLFITCRLEGKTRNRASKPRRLQSYESRGYRFRASSR